MALSHFTIILEALSHVNKQLIINVACRNGRVACQLKSQGRQVKGRVLLVYYYRTVNLDHPLGLPV